MKKLMLASACALFGIVSAQETETAGFVQGDTFITGAIGYSNVSQGDNKTDNFSVAPSIGYFVSPNFALGARASYVNSKSSNETANINAEIKSDIFTVGAFGRYYFTPASKFSLFGEVNADYAHSKVSANAAGTELSNSKVNGFDFGIAPGINYFISKNFALEASYGILRYSSNKQDVDGAVASDNFQVGLDLNDLTLGLVYKF